MRIDHFFTREGLRETMHVKWLKQGLLCSRYSVIFSFLSPLILCPFAPPWCLWSCCSAFLLKIGTQRFGSGFLILIFGWIIQYGVGLCLCRTFSSIPLDASNYPSPPSSHDNQKSPWTWPSFLWAKSSPVENHRPSGWWVVHRIVFSVENWILAVILEWVNLCAGHSSLCSWVEWTSGIAPLSPIGRNNPSHAFLTCFGGKRSSNWF